MLTQLSDPFWGTSGPRNARILVVGEAWGREEAIAQRPFVGQSGRELFRMLNEALKLEAPLLNAALSARSMAQWITIREQWLQRTGILIANVIPAQPPNNDFTHFLYPTAEAKGAKHAEYYGIYPRPELARAIRSLWQLIALVNPSIVVATGNWALHILTPHANISTDQGYRVPTGITNWRGSQTWCDHARSRGWSGHPPSTEGSGGFTKPNIDPPVLAPTSTPLLPIIHPAAILREWGYRHVTVHDLRSRLGRYLNRTLAWPAPSYNDCWRPTLSDVRTALGSWRARVDSAPLWLSVDIETYGKRHITCTGLCDGDLALCIPWFYFTTEGAGERQRAVDYWSLEEELWIITELRTLLEHPNIRIVGQNFIYDTQYFSRNHLINALVSGDTMVAHHLLYPGTPKSLEMLASLYNNHYVYWKDESEEWAADAVSAEDLWHYNCIDTRRTLEAWHTLWSIIQHEKMEPLYADRIDQWLLARAMTLQGVPQNQSLRVEFTHQLYRELAPVEDWLLEAVPPNWQYTSAGKPWFTSNQAIARVLYEVAGISPILHKKTKRPTTDDTAILELCERRDTRWLAPLLERVRDWRSAQIFKNNFLEIPLDPLGRWPMQVNVAQPETFRWSTGKNAFDEGSNMQNLPKMED